VSNQNKENVYIGRGKAQKGGSLKRWGKKKGERNRGSSNRGGRSLERALGDQKVNRSRR